MNRLVDNLQPRADEPAAPGTDEHENNSAEIPV
jgi:hypothetical protein